MADNVIARANTGSGTDILATKELAGGVQLPKALLVDGSGVEFDAGNPVPVEIQGSIPVTIASAIEITNDAGSPIPVESPASDAKLDSVTDLLREVAYRLSDIADSVGNLMPDTSGRIRVAAETLGTLSTITTVSTVTNQAQMGAMALNAYVATISQMNEGDLRRNVVIS